MCPDSDRKTPRELSTDELLDCALDVVHGVRQLDISNIQHETILVYALDRLRAERYYKMFNPELPKELKP